MQEPEVITISDDEDSDHFIISIDIGIDNLAYSIYNQGTDVFTGCKNQRLSIHSKYAANDISRACISVASEIVELIPTESLVTVLIEHQLVKAGRSLIHGKLVTLKCIETSFYTFFIGKGYQVESILPKRVVKHFEQTMDTRSRYRKKKSSVVMVNDYINTKEIRLSIRARRGWDASSKKDDMADCLLITIYRLYRI